MCAPLIVSGKPLEVHSRIVSQIPSPLTKELLLCTPNCKEVATGRHSNLFKQTRRNKAVLFAGVIPNVEQQDIQRPFQNKAHSLLVRRVAESKTVLVVPSLLSVLSFDP